MEDERIKEVVDGNPEDQASCGCSPGPEETDEQWEERTKNSPKLILYALLGIVIIIALIMGIKYFYNPTPAIPTGSIIAIPEQHPTKELSNKYTYNGQKFVKRGDMWYTEIQKGNTLWEVEFYYGPKELEDVPISGEFTEVFQGDEVYVTFDPREEGNLKYLALAIGHLDTNLIKSFGKKIIPGCIVNETEACAGVPVINCESTEDKAVVFMKIVDNPGVTLEDNCITIQGKGWGLIKATEQFLMKGYGVI